jgi:PiT family inorganic phosphate transporter
MAANGSGLETEAPRNVLLAWVLTLAVCVLLGSMLFAFGRRLLDMLLPKETAYSKEQPRRP